MSDLIKIREELIATIPRDCLDCDACGKPNPAHQCRKCFTTHYCSSECLRKLASHECHDIDTMRNALVGIEKSLDMSQAKNQTCGICLGTPIVDPAVLPCTHAFCRSCLREWHAMEKFNKEIKCLLCRGVLLFDKSEENPIEKAKIYGAQAKKAEEANRPEGKVKACKKALEELDNFLSTHETNLSALFTKAEILLIQSEPQSALEVIDEIFRIDHENRTNRQAVSDYLDQANAATEETESVRLLKLAEDIAGTRGERIGQILQTLVEVFLLQAEAYQQLGDWFTAKEIYKDLLGLGSGIPTWILGAAGLSIILVATLVFGNYKGQTLTKLRNVTMAALVATILYGLIGRFVMATPKSKSKVLTFDLELRTPLVPQQRHCYMAMVKCYYHLKEYDRAIRAGAFALHMNRHFPGVHENIGKTYLAKGNAKEAIRTMRRAVLYETPWDIQNIQKQLKLLRAISTST
eukprot:scaffold2510_cov169-Amphora_coffeaeformis.AAC.46